MGCLSVPVWPAYVATSLDFSQRFLFGDQPAAACFQLVDQTVRDLEVLEQLVVSMVLDEGDRDASLGDCRGDRGRRCAASLESIVGFLDEALGGHGRVARVLLG